MNDTFITVIAIGVAVILMFVFPLMTVSERSDDVSQLSVQTATTQYVDKIRTTGKMTLSDYDKFVQTINATGNTFDVEIELQILDENPAKKTAQVSYTKIGENVYYSKYTSQILSDLKNSSQIKLKEGDRISVSVKNTNTTISQLFRNFLYKVTKNENYQIGASSGGIVTVNGR